MEIGAKRPGRVAYHSLPCSSEDNNGGVIPPVRPPAFVLLTWWFIKILK
jgi:hypothetical protein